MVLKSAPTAGVPEKACPFCDGDIRCRTARAKPDAMSLAAPLPGVTVTTTPTASTATHATLVEARENQRARSRGRLPSSGALSSSPGTTGFGLLRRPTRTCTWSPASHARILLLSDELRYLIVMDRVRLYQSRALET